MTSTVFTSVPLPPTATSGPESVPGPDQSWRMDCGTILHCENSVPLHCELGSSPALILQTVDVLIALCLAGITRLAMEDQVRAGGCLQEVPTASSLSATETGEGEWWVWQGSGRHLGEG